MCPGFSPGKELGVLSGCGWDSFDHITSWFFPTSKLTEPAMKGTGGHYIDITWGEHLKTDLKINSSCNYRQLSVSLVAIHVHTLKLAGFMYVSVVPVDMKR